MDREHINLVILHQIISLKLLDFSLNDIKNALTEQADSMREKIDVVKCFDDDTFNHIAPITLDIQLLRREVIR